MNHFKLFGLPQDFEVDIDQLTERYRELQRTFHPDNFANASALERRLSVQRAAQINQAFHTLKQPVERARYLLELHGVDTESETAKVEQSFLLEQMELREVLAEIRNQSDPVAVLTELTDDIRHRTEVIIRELGEQFQDASTYSLSAARENVDKLMFLNKIQQEADEIFDELLEY